MLKKKKERERIKVGDGGKGAGEENETSAKGLRILKSDSGSRGTWRELGSPQACLQALRLLKSTFAFKIRILSWASIRTEFQGQTKQNSFLVRTKVYVASDL